MKQETLEEVAERLVKETTLYGDKNATIGSSSRSYFETELRCVLLGMKWQRERSYSEEELNKIKEYANLSLQNLNGRESIEEIFDAGIEAGIEEFLETLKNK